MLPHFISKVKQSRQYVGCNQNTQCIVRSRLKLIKKIKTSRTISIGLVAISTATFPTSAWQWGAHIYEKEQVQLSNDHENPGQICIQWHDVNIWKMYRRDWRERNATNIECFEMITCSIFRYAGNVELYICTAWLLGLLLIPKKNNGFREELREKTSDFFSQTGFRMLLFANSWAAKWWAPEVRAKKLWVIFVLFFFKNAMKGGVEKMASSLLST